MILCVLLIFVVLFLLITGLIIAHFQRHLPVKNGTRCLLLIAHPDDECMFFAPTIVHLIQKQCKFYVLCATTGNADGLGHLRKDELFNSCRQLGISSDFVTIMDVGGLMDGQQKWETERLAKIVLQHMERLDIELVVTFDEKGVSSHPNHISCFHALQYLYTNGLVPQDVQIFVLETVSLVRKYIGLLDLYQSFFSATFMILSSPWNAWLAMRAHKSQLVWFRYLYLIFSRYIIVNTLKRISLHRFMVNKKRN